MSSGRHPPAPARKDVPVHHPPRAKEQTGHAKEHSAHRNGGQHPPRNGGQHPPRPPTHGSPRPPQANGRRPFRPPQKDMTFQRPRPLAAAGPLRAPESLKRKSSHDPNFKSWESQSKRQRTLYKGTRIQYQEVPESLDEPPPPIPGSFGPWAPRNVSDYKMHEKSGSGVYGDVFKSVAPSGEIVALKHLRIEYQEEGLPLTVLREIMLLKKLNSENVVKLLDVVTKQNANMTRKQAEIYMVLEWCDHDLAGLIKMKEMKFPLNTVKWFLQGIVKGCNQLRQNGILHRDLKPANILISKDACVKLADFGLARAKTKGNMTNENKIVTRYYRAPELLLRGNSYDDSIDMWSVGCIFGEMLKRVPIFSASRDIDQLQVIEDTCGSFDEVNWPASKDFNFVPVSKIKKARNLKQRFMRRMRVEDGWTVANEHTGLDLLDKLLQWDPLTRLKADKAVEHPFFTTEPQAHRPGLPAKNAFEWAHIQKRLAKQKKNNAARRNQGYGFRQGKQPYHPQTGGWNTGGQDIGKKFSAMFKP